MTKRKKLILKLAGILLAVLLVCTFLSHSVYQLLLPEVTLAQVSRTTVARTAYATGTLDALKQRIIRAGAPWTVTEVLVENGASVQAGTPILKVDNTAFQITEKQLLLERQAIADTSVWGSKEKAKKQTRLEIYDLQLAQLRAGTPADGVVTASEAGIISGLTATVGETLPEGTEAFRLTPRNTDYEIHITLPMDEGTEFRQNATAYAALDVMGMDRIERKLAVLTERVACDVKSSTLDAEGQWHYVLTPQKVPEGVVAGQVAQVTLSNNSATYEAVVPAEAVIDQQDGTYAVYVAEERDGLFGKELYVTKTAVTVENTNGLRTAVSGGLYATQQVVTSTTSPLSDGDCVRVDLS